MNHFVVYHNAETMGFDARTIKGFSIVTTKSTMGVVGSRIWLIAGRGTPRTYTLVQTFIAEKAGRLPDAPNVTEVSASIGTKYRPELPLNHLPWFPEFKRTVGNFGLGLQRIASPVFIRELQALDAHRHTDGEGEALYHDLVAEGQIAADSSKRKRLR